MIYLVFMDAIKRKIHDVFDKCQERRYNLAKLADVLKRFYFEVTTDTEKKEEFFSQFLYFVECLLQNSDRDVATERCVQFIAIFAAHFVDCDDEDDEEVASSDDNLYNYLVNFIIKPEVHCHSNKTVRFRVCQLVQLFLNALPQNAALDEDLMERMTKVMLDRILDKIPSIRVQAARSLRRLQQPSVKECPVIEAYLFHMACDDSANVRASVLSNISVTTKTLPCLLDRTRDISENVRKIAFQMIAQKVSIKALTSSQRLYLIKQGLMDSSDAVREVVKKQLFQAWLLTFDASLMDLLKKLDVIGAYDTCCGAMNAMFECSSLNDLVEGFALLNDKKLIDFEKLTAEAALYWLQLCEYMRKKDIEGCQYLDKLLPSAFIFSDYIDNYVTEVLLPITEKSNKVRSAEEEDDRVEKEFVAEQLLKIAVAMDLSDNAGRKKMKETFSRAITSLDVIYFPCLTSPLSRGLIDMHSSNLTPEREEDEKVSLIASLISNTREAQSVSPGSVTLSEDEVGSIKQQIAKLTMQLNEDNEALEKFIEAKHFSKAGELQKDIDENKRKLEELQRSLEPQPAQEEASTPILKDDVATIIKCLLMAKEVLASVFESRCKHIQMRRTTPRGIHSTLLQLLESFIIPSVLNSSPEVRKEAVCCLGIGCMYSPPLAARHFPLLMQVSQADTYIVRVSAINAVNDLIRLYGVKVLVPNKEKTTEENLASDNDLPDETLQDEYDVADVGFVIIGKFMDMLDDEERDIREAATTLLTRVLVSHRILSSAALSRLILLWYNPTNWEDEPSLLHIISKFLDIFPYMSKESHECIESAFLPILRVLFNAPPTSPFASINISNVAELMINITRPSIIKQADLKGICDERNTKWLAEGSAHDNFAVMLSNEVLGNPRSAYVNTLCKILPQLDLNPLLTDNLQDVEVLCSNMLKDVKDKQAIRHIRKFQTQVSGLIKNSKKLNLNQSEERTDQECKENNQLPDAENESTALTESAALKQLNSTQPASSPTNFDSPLSSTKSLRNCRTIGQPKRNLTETFANAD